MKPDKILYVDDEAMSLKYFDRLVSPLIPVLTAQSVEEGKALLDERGSEIAVLVSDQRMPGAYGNELLRYARERHPLIVRMLTTAYSELGEAIEAINSGEIYRYITKPWDLDTLKTELKNAMELADLRNERDGLLREKMLLLQQQLMAQRVSQLAVICAGVTGHDCNESLYTYLEGASKTGCSPEAVDWEVLDYFELMQAEAVRGIALGRQLSALHDKFGHARSSSDARGILAAALPELVALHDKHVHVSRPQSLYAVLNGASTDMPPVEAVTWLAWLIWMETPIKLQADSEGWKVFTEITPVPLLPRDWLAGFIEKLQPQLK